MFNSTNPLFEQSSTCTHKSCAFIGTILQLRESPAHLDLYELHESH